MGFQVHAEALPHFTIVCHVRFPLRAKAASHPWGHTHMRPSRSVSNNYHATNHQPVRNKGAKKETSSDGAEWRTRCRCASVASPSRHMGHTLRVQNDDGAEFVVERGVAVYGVSVARTGCKRKLQPCKAEVFVRERMADTKKATTYAMTQKAHRNICSTTA